MRLVPDVTDAASARGLTRPTVLCWLRDLTSTVGAEQALRAWADACQATGHHGLDLDLEPLEAIGLWLGEHSTSLPLRAAARSCLARLRVYRLLTVTTARTMTNGSAT